MSEYDFYFENEPNDANPEEIEELANEVKQAVKDDPVEEKVDESPDDENLNSDYIPPDNQPVLEFRGFLPTWGWWISAIVGIITASMYLISNDTCVDSTVFFKAVIVAIFFGGVMALGIKAIIKTSLLEYSDKPAEGYEDLEEFEYFDELEDYEEYEGLSLKEIFSSFFKEPCEPKAGVKKEEQVELDPIVPNMSRFCPAYANALHEQHKQVENLQQEFDDFINRKEVAVEDKVQYQDTVAEAVSVVVNTIETADAWTKRRCVSNSGLAKDIEKIIESNDVIIDELATLISNMRTDETRACVDKSQAAVESLKSMNEKLSFYPDPHMQ